MEAAAEKVAFVAVLTGNGRHDRLPGIHSSRIHIIDTKPDPRNPKIVKVIEPETLASRARYPSLHTVRTVAVPAEFPCWIRKASMYWENGSPANGGTPIW